MILCKSLQDTGSAETFQKPHRSSGHQRAKQLADQPINMAVGQDGQIAIPMVQPVFLYGGSSGKNQLIVAVHNAAGGAGGAGGKENGGDTGISRGDCLRRLRPAPKRFPAGDIQNYKGFKCSRQLFGRRGAAPYCPHLAEVQQSGQLRLGKGSVQQYGGGAQFFHRQISDAPLGAAFGEDGNPVAGTDAKPLQNLGITLCLRKHLCIRENFYLSVFPLVLHSCVPAPSKRLSLKGFKNVHRFYFLSSVLVGRR